MRTVSNLRQEPYFDQHHCPAMALLSLNCWVYGDTPDEMFTVKIDKMENVNILKAFIKEENANSFGKFDAKQLDLRKVCLLLDNLHYLES